MGWGDLNPWKAAKKVVKKVGKEASNLGSSIDDAITQPVVNTVKDVGSQLDDFVNDVLPGGWTTAALIAAGYYYYPEISAWVNASGTSAVPAAEVAAADTAAGAEAVSGIDLGGAGASPNTWTNAGAGKALTAGQVLNYARGGLLVNALTGDPLGLGGEQPSGGGQTGFDIVPIPTSWKSPTYAQSSAPIDLESIFSTNNMLGGTQWQGMQNQRPNITFNDIFASGQQRTPMGQPVDINQIVSAILGQNAASQKST